MKQYFLLLGVFVLIFIIFEGCNAAKTSLVVTITSHPQGGVAVSNVSCTFQGELRTHGGGIFGSKDVHSITAIAEWWWEKTDGNTEIVKSDTYIFTSESSTQCSTVYSATLGDTLFDYYWVKIKWTDEDNSSHFIESSKAYCY